MAETCEICTANEIEVAVLPLRGQAPNEIIFANRTGYTCLECAYELIESGDGREVPIVSHNAVFKNETVENNDGWLHSSLIVDAIEHR